MIGLHQSNILQRPENCSTLFFLGGLSESLAIVQRMRRNVSPQNVREAVWPKG